MRRRKWLARVALSAWLVGMILVGAALVARHLPVAQAQTRDGEVALATLRRPADGDAWLMLHVLYAECRCTRRIVDHLVSSPRPDHVVERVLLVGEDRALVARLTAAGFEVLPTTAIELGDRFGIEAGPLFAVILPSGRLVYRGGYTDRKQAADVKDVEIVAHLRDGAAAPALPLYGCAISARLRARIDPLGL